MTHNTRTDVSAAACTGRSVRHGTAFAVARPCESRGSSNTIRIIINNSNARAAGAAARYVDAGRVKVAEET